jgi:hypothetical protein
MTTAPGEQLAVGGGALLSHGTAAWRWRIIPAPPSVITLATPRRRGGMPGIEVFGSARLRADDTTHNGRFSTTIVPRTRLDVATGYDFRARRRFISPWPGTARRGDRRPPPRARRAVKLGCASRAAA